MWRPMKKPTRALAFFLLITISLMLFSGCGQEEAAPSEEEAAPYIGTWRAELNVIDRLRADVVGMTNEYLGDVHALLDGIDHLILPVKLSFQQNGFMVLTVQKSLFIRNLAFVLRDPVYLQLLNSMEGKLSPDVTLEDLLSEKGYTFDMFLEDFIESLPLNINDESAQFTASGNVIFFGENQDQFQYEISDDRMVIVDYIRKYPDRIAHTTIGLLGSLTPVTLRKETASPSRLAIRRR